jgi:hypothetical protein
MCSCKDAGNTIDYTDAQLASISKKQEVTNLAPDYLVCTQPTSKEKTLINWGKKAASTCHSDTSNES